ncbi:MULTISPECIES: hypothetical protein [unclassified Amycolatopsis]|uniref:hypothetical protein n=1 Tax=unclassified Amycolatopsis TaxID=2618356 RepID=UPI0028767ACB|nr:MULTISPECIES: hypothetical protein [unclassified Amycolatopsis]MDS0132960.1 hypothetical protein [Amycolatopsis sp. 505]MDS0142215.1 hypothetical protein [Amycolatopsis sp. CM201R]
MSSDQLAAALARLDEHRELHLPLRKTDLLGRLALRFLWKRQVKWQIEANLAIRDALAAVHHTQRELPADAVRHAELAHEVELLRQQDKTMTAGLNQRLYAGLGRIESQLSELKLQQAETAEQGDDTELRLKALETQVAALASAAADARLRHAQLDVALDRVRAGQAVTEVATDVADRESFLELALSQLLDGPESRVREARKTHLSLITAAREAGANGPVFDVAPGRGEWLEVLRSADLPYLAASDNKLVRQHCAGLGLDVAAQEPLAALAAVPARSLGAVTAFRFAERRTPDALARFADLAATALQPGGVLLVETPGPGAETEFRLDPFARKPLHPVYLRFVAEAAGFPEVDVREVAAADGLGERLCLIARR